MNVYASTFNSSEDYNYKKSNVINDCKKLKELIESNDSEVAIVEWISYSARRYRFFLDIDELDDLEDDKPIIEIIYELALNFISFIEKFFNISLEEKDRNVVITQKMEDKSFKKSFHVYFNFCAKLEIIKLSAFLFSTSVRLCGAIDTYIYVEYCSLRCINSPKSSFSNKRGYEKSKSKHLIVYSDWEKIKINRGLPLENLEFMEKTFITHGDDTLMIGVRDEDIPYFIENLYGKFEEYDPKYQELEASKFTKMVVKRKTILPNKFIINGDYRERVDMRYFREIIEKYNLFEKNEFL